LSFRARLTCDGVVTDSEIATLTLRTTPDRGIRNGSQWLKHLAGRVTGSSFVLREAFPAETFVRPVDFQYPGDGTNRVFVVEQGGRIYVLENTATPTKRLFLDISDRLKSGGEQGLLAMAFHPRYQQNGLFFVHYSDAEDGDTVIARYSVSATDPNAADPASEKRFLRVDQPFANHNGGQITFGNDGYLYIALGDGGSAGDPEGNGQKPSSLLGKILRIDVDTPSTGREYSIPNDNPFKNSTTFREEIWAWGLRNPFKISFDRPTGRLWAGDVGQNKLEEVDLILRGRNYGWNTMEGSQCFNPSTGCNREGLELPIAEYGRSAGQSITGGYVYRGRSIPALVGIYVYADFITGRVFGLRFGNGKTVNSQLVDTEHLVSSFGLDRENELYLLAYTTGKIFRFTKAS
jgi:glucose/arabinose dehydrogenase